VTSSCLAQKNRADGNDVRVCEVTTESLLCECFRPFWADDEQTFPDPVTRVSQTIQESVRSINTTGLLRFLDVPVQPSAP
jgi:hypothetical protein